MAPKHGDPDLPGDERFRPVSNIGVVRVPNPTGGPDLLAQVNLQPVSIEEQRAIHHNQLRYGELNRLRMGMPNSYLQTSYR